MRFVKRSVWLCALGLIACTRRGHVDVAPWLSLTFESRTLEIPHVGGKPPSEWVEITRPDGKKATFPGRELAASLLSKRCAIIDSTGLFFVACKDGTMQPLGGGDCRNTI